MKSKRTASFLVVASLSIACALPVATAFAFQSGGEPSSPQPQLQPEGSSAAPVELPEVYSQPASAYVQAASSPQSASRVTTGNAQNVRPNPKPSKCLMLAKTIGASRVWWGRHVGAKEVEDDTLFFSVGPRRIQFDDIGCFKTKKDCENWLYWKRTDYPIFSSISACRRGL